MLLSNCYQLLLGQLGYSNSPVSICVCYGNKPMIMDVYIARYKIDSALRYILHFVIKYKVIPSEYLFRDIYFDILC